MKNNLPSVEYIAGFFDGEGSVPNIATKTSAILKLVNTDLDIMNKISDKLFSIGINNTVLKRKKYSKKHKDCYLLQISSSYNVYMFYKLIPLIMKRKALLTFLKNFNKISVPTNVFNLDVRHDYTV